LVEHHNGIVGVAGSNPVGSTSSSSALRLENMKFHKLEARDFDALLFGAKAAGSAVSATLVYDLFGLPGAVWAAISAVMVIQPGFHTSLRASIMRFTANIIGGLVGVLLSTLLGHDLAALAPGIILTAILCYFFKLDDALRPACAALVIVILTTNSVGVNKWLGPLERVLAVAVGSICSLVVNFLCDKIAERFKFLRKADKPKPAE
jgi:uncharacterized membrane protein YgaE (UPF0421/DUF939 family)